MLVAALVAAACIVRTLLYPFEDPDLWQHLAVGRAIWALHRVPLEHLWTWPSYGQPDVLPSWIFRALLWPWYAAGGVVGITLLRWLLALGAFGIAWATARVLGARGLLPLTVLVLCALSYRARSQLRPEMLVAILLALEVWVLENRRRGARLRWPALLAIACVWANLHLSFFFGWAVLAIHALLAPEPGVRGWWRSRRPLLATLAGAMAISFVNPFGWRALWQPVEYFTVWRHDSIYRAIPELLPFWEVWRVRLATGLPVLLVLWPLLVLGRPRGRRFDPVEAATCFMFTVLTVYAQRFASFYAIAIAPYLARDLAAWTAGWSTPRVLSGSATRTAITAAACVLLCLPAWSESTYPVGIGFAWTYYPVGACDRIESAHLGGRIFNPYYFGGYLLWRFWPQRDRLPFMDIHQTGTRQDREWSGYAPGEPRAWKSLDEERHFQLAVIDGHIDWIWNYHLPDALDADTSWALVFRDDAAMLYVRREGANAGIADSLAYRFVPGGFAAWNERFGLVIRDREVRALARAELERMRRESPQCGWAESELGAIAYMDGDRAGARRHLESAIRLDPRLPAVHRQLGYLDLADGRPRDAIAAFNAELALHTTPLDLYRRMGEAHEALGDRAHAIEWYRRAVENGPDAAAQAALDRLQRE
jgi:hypothetical protein